MSNKFSSTLMVNVGKPSNTRKQYFGRLITINPNIVMSKDDPEYPDYKRYLEHKYNELFTRANARKYVNYLGDVDFDDITIRAKSVLEYGEETGKLHFHVSYIMFFNVPRGVPLEHQSSIGIDYVEFFKVVKEVFHEPEFKSIKVLWSKLNMTDANINEYFNKGHYL